LICTERIGLVARMCKSVEFRKLRPTVNRPRGKF
jgi:hypothetical protein